MNAQKSVPMSPGAMTLNFVDPAFVFRDAFVERGLPALGEVQ